MTSLPQFDEMWDYDNPEGTEATFRQILGSVALEGPVEYRSELLTADCPNRGPTRTFRPGSFHA